MISGAYDMVGHRLEHLLSSRRWLAVLIEEPAPLFVADAWLCGRGRKCWTPRRRRCS